MFPGAHLEAMSTHDVLVMFGLMALVACALVCAISLAAAARLALLRRWRNARGL